MRIHDNGTPGDNSSDIAYDICTVADFYLYAPVTDSCALAGRAVTVVTEGIGRTVDDIIFGGATAAEVFADGDDTLIGGNFGEENTARYGVSGLNNIETMALCGQGVYGRGEFTDIEAIMLSGVADDVAFIVGAYGGVSFVKFVKALGGGTARVRRIS